jgi:hypothetical protein
MLWSACYWNLEVIYNCIIVLTCLLIWDNLMNLVWYIRKTFSSSSELNSKTLVPLRTCFFSPGPIYLIKLWNEIFLLVYIPAFSSQPLSPIIHIPILEIWPRTHKASGFPLSYTTRFLLSFSLSLSVRVCVCEGIVMVTENFFPSSHFKESVIWA